MERASAHAESRAVQEFKANMPPLVSHYQRELSALNARIDRRLVKVIFVYTANTFAYMSSQPNLCTDSKYKVFFIRSRIKITMRDALGTMHNLLLNLTLLHLQIHFFFFLHLISHTD